MEVMEVVGEDGDLDNSSEKPFVFYESVSTLQSIASHTVALQVWHHYLTRGKCGKIREKTYGFDSFTEVLNVDRYYTTNSEKLIELLKTPQSIEKMLKKSLKKIFKETRLWIYHFQCEMFRERISTYYDVGNFDMNHIIWRHNCEIDRKRSVLNMLAEGNLSVEQKFVLMCSYGMADELERFPMNSLSELFQILGISDMIVAYWISHHRPDLREIWLRIADVIRPEGISIDMTMATACAKRSLPYAFEYFWNRLHEDELVLYAVEILPCSSEFLKIMLTSMSSFRQLQLLYGIPVKLMTTFCVQCDMPEYAFTIWTRIKHVITKHQFDQFMYDVFSESDVMRSEKCMSMLINVWDSVSDRFKRHVAENNPWTIFNSFMYCSYNQHYSLSNSYRFFMKFLPFVNEQTRKDLYLDVEVDSRICCPDILNLCIPNKAEQLKLKNSVMKLDYMLGCCADSFMYMEFDEVITRVTFYSPNAGETRNFIEKILRSDKMRSESFILQYEAWNKLSNFIDTVFTTYMPTSDISSLKKQLVSSFSTSAVHCWDKKENVDALVKITEQVFPEPEEMKTFKQTLLKHFQKTISSLTSWRSFEGKCYNNFVSWCSDDENQITDFRSIVQIDKFFDDIFRLAILSSSEDNRKNLLKQLDAFLRYVCVSDEEAKILKVRKYYDRILEIRVFPRPIMYQISNWFFSNNN